jgi:hypothetical protein
MIYLKRNYIFVPPVEISPNNMEYGELLTWAHENNRHESVLELSEEAIYALQSVLDIINDENNYIIEYFDGGWVNDQETKKKILNRLATNTDYEHSIYANTFSKIIHLFEQSINTRQPIIFHF